ncbi:MAG: HD domain-containing phosphohydrolase [Syntrophomonas sp.]
MLERQENLLRIMVIDDTAANLRLLDDLLRSRGYGVFAFPRGDMALKAAEQNPPDLILLDINMPEMNGFEVCEKFKANKKLKDIPVIFISALNEPLDKVKAFSTGAVDYVNKPFQFEEVLARVETHLKIHRLQVEMEDYNLHLQELVQEKVKEITDSQLATILALAKLAESRDDDTGDHLERVQAFAGILARQLSLMSNYSSIVTPEFSKNLFYACSLHDIGKVGIPDNILLKPGKLSLEEFEIMKTHASLGAETLESVYEKYPNNALIKMGIAIARHHHERWDGKGYPTGLAGENIPLPARIMSVVDVYDALRSERCYKAAMPQDQVLKIILEGSGSQFDPTLVKAFVQVANDFDRISRGEQ